MKKYLVHLTLVGNESETVIVEADDSDDAAYYIENTEGYLRGRSSYVNCKYIVKFKVSKNSIGGNEDEMDVDELIKYL